MATATLITGGNIGDVEVTLQKAKDVIAQKVGKIVAVSSLMTSEPWGKVESDDDEEVGGFVNQVLEVETQLTPMQLLETVLEVEKELGRKRGESGLHSNDKAERLYKSRIIDIDVLYYDDLVVETKELTIPHPMMEQREFVLLPLNQIAPHKKHPINGKTTNQMLMELRQQKIDENKQ